ncbi:hypothetical protein [uncultured Limosilactobacillus sp.]|uniref:hypothetical protein n=1 Tax=uncultured Limosilactobacillus sp. TaxID=2837629 RepID=UPI0025CE2D1E|nr:hypothetical protein [uncultured Limosilactobacillus sp.]
MPKPGQFAQSHHQKISRPIQQRHQVKRQRTISLEIVNDFVIVRYRLTTGKHFNPVDRETGQRFLQELMPRLIQNQFDLKAALWQTLSSVNARVPWQFFYQLSQNWQQLSHFLDRELPALPLKKRVVVKHPVSQVMFDQQVAKLLAQRIISMTLVKKFVDTVTKQTLVDQMLSSIMQDRQIRWSSVQALLAPWPFPIDQELDEGTQSWLKSICELQM